MSATSEKRRPPAFQCYASDDLACADYYRLTLAERGLLDAMRRACWVDGSIPKGPDALALAVRRPVDEVAAAMSAALLRHFAPHDSDPTLMVCPELERQRSGLMDRRRKQQDAAERTNEARGRGKRDAERDGKRDGKRDAERDGKRDGKRDAERDAPEMSRDEVRGEEKRSTEKPDSAAAATSAPPSSSLPADDATAPGDDWSASFADIDPAPAAPSPAAPSLSAVPALARRVIPPASDPKGLAALARDWAVVPAPNEGAAALRLRLVRRQAALAIGGALQ